MVLGAAASQGRGAHDIHDDLGAWITGQNGCAAGQDDSTTVVSSDFGAEILEPQDDSTTPHPHLRHIGGFPLILNVSVATGIKKAIHLKEMLSDWNCSGIVRATCTACYFRVSR